MYSAALMSFLIRLGPHSRLGTKLLGIGLRYVSAQCRSSLLTGLGPHSRFGDKLRGLRLRQKFMSSAGLKRLSGAAYGAVFLCW